jgi:outer membrane protein assembly factor BamB
MKAMWLPVLLMASLVVLPTAGAEAHHSTFEPGDLFVSLVTGHVQWRHPDGTLNKVLTGVMPGRAGGMSFDAAGNLYVTHFCEGAPYVHACTTGNGVEVFDPTAIPLGSFGRGYSCNPYSIRFDASGNAYVGQLDCEGDILRFDAAGNPLAAYDVATEPDADWRGSGWIDLAADECTVLYTSGGRNVKQFDVCANAQLPDFTTVALPDPTAKALRVLPDGGVLLTNVSVIVRLNAAGEVEQIYDVPGEPDAWGWLDLVGDGTFWVSNYGSSNVYRLDIVSGMVLGGFNVNPQPFTTIGIAVKR